MFEKFTDRARKVMALSNQEAQRFNHEYIGTEHLLLGMCKEGSGVACNVLKNMGIDLRKARLEVEKLVKCGPDFVSMGKLPHTPRAKKVFEYAIEEAKNLNHNYVGTEHLLLGLLREHEGVAANVLINLGLTIGGVKQETLSLLGAEPDTKRSPTPKENISDSILASGKIVGEIAGINGCAKTIQDFTIHVSREEELKHLRFYVVRDVQNNVEYLVAAGEDVDNRLETLKSMFESFMIGAKSQIKNSPAGN